MIIRNSLVILVLLAFLPSSHADKLFLKDGRVIEGELSGEFGGKYLFKYTNDKGKIENEFFKITDVESYEEEDGDQSVPPPQPTENSKQIGESQNETENSKQSGESQNGTEKDSADFRWVIARGAGMSSDEAKNDAWRNAIEQVAGVFITANSQIENGQLVKDNIIAHSNAYIEHFDLIDEDIVDGIVRVQIKALVATKSIFAKLQSLGGELEFRSVDGESKHAKIVTKNQRTKSAIETLPAAMRGYPEELFDIEIGETRIAMEGVFKDGKEHLIVPVTFSWNNNAWDQFSKNLNEYLKHVSSDSDTFRLRLQGLKVGADNHYKRGVVTPNCLSKRSWLKVGWERCVLKNGEYPYCGRFSFDDKLNGMFDIGTVWDQVNKSYSHDYIKDVVVILDSKLKQGNSYAVSRAIWSSLLHRMKQTPAFNLKAVSKIDGGEIGQPYSKSEFDYSLFRYSSEGDGAWFESIPMATGVRGAKTFDRAWSAMPNDVTDLREFDKSDTENSPRVMLILPYFSGGFDDNWFNYRQDCFFSEFSYDYAINLELGEVKNIDRVEIKTYVLDLHNKKRRENVE